MGLRGLQIIAFLVLIIPMVIFDVGLLQWSILNGLGLGLNLLVLFSFLGTFFYLNFKMTGIMMESRLN